MSSAMELRAEMVDRQRSGSEADEMRDRKRRQSTASIEPPRSYAAVVGLTAAAAAARMRQRQLTRTRAAVAPEPPV